MSTIFYRKTEKIALYVLKYKKKGENKMKNNIRFYRKKAGYTQSALADKLGYNQTLLSKWEIGERDPSCETLINLSYYLKVSIDNLLDNKNNINQQNDNRIIQIFNTNSISLEQENLIKLAIKLNEINLLKAYSYINGLYASQN